MKKVLYWVTSTVLAAGFFAILFSSCSDHNGGNSAPAKVGLYITDDMADYKQVVATVTKVQVLHTGSGAVCDLLTTPETLDIAELSQVLQLVTVSTCTAVPYNRIHLEFEKSVELMNSADIASPCSFTSYKDQGTAPNVLQCNGSTCSLDINGAVNVLVNQQNKLALDFVLKDFVVRSFGDPAACSVTMKVSPLHAMDMEARGHPEGVTGLISGLSTTDRTFNLTRGNTVFSVLYSGITSSRQPGLDSLLELAQAESLRVKVVSSSIDFSAQTISATAVYVKVEGTVSDLDAMARTFTLTYKADKTIVVDYSSAGVDGILDNGDWVALKLYGFEGEKYLASKIEVREGSITTDD
jgi:hypothetical protein